MDNIKETAFDWTSADNVAYFSSNEQKWINKMRDYAEKHPTEVTILHAPENNGGYMVARVPKSWAKVSPPRKVNFSEERKAELREQLKSAREKKV